MDRDLRAWLEAKLDRLERRYRSRGRLFRVLWVVAAVLVLLVGLLLTVVPGPAILVLTLGLAMLTAAFGWAHRLMMLGVARLPADGFRRSRRLGLALGLLGLVLAAAVVVTFMVTGR